jgi:Recombinase
VPGEAEIVREIISNIAESSTLYAEAKRLNDLSIAAPGWRYGTGTTISKIVRQRAYSGTHEITINGGEDRIEQAVPAILDATLQERAKAALLENKRYPDRKGDRKYLLAGLVKCEPCGFAYTGRPTTKGGSSTTTTPAAPPDVTGKKAAPGTSRLT